MEIVPQEADESTLSRTLITRPVWVAICGRPEVEGFRIWVHSNSTFSDIQRELVSTDPAILSGAMVLQPKYGVRPYWTQPEPLSRIEDSCRMLYVVLNGESTLFLLCLVRTASTDYPLVIVDSNRSLTVSQAIEFAQPDLAGRIMTITDHSGKTSIRDAQLDFISRVNTRLSNFPTVFFATTNEVPKNFSSDEPPGPVPPLLQTSMVHCEYLLQQASSLEIFHGQTAHLLQAARHLILSLAEGLKYLFDPRYPETEDALIADGSLAELLPVAPSLAGKIKELLGRIEKVMRALRSGEPNFEGIKDVVDHIFDRLCGDFPGAVVVRSSYRIFQKLALKDYEGLLRRYNDRGPPEGHVVMTRIFDVQKRIADALKDDLGSKNPDTLKAMLNMATTCVELGRYTEARSIQVKALKMLRKVRGEHHPDTLHTIKSLASTLNALGQFSDAEKYAKEAVSGMESTLGLDHSETNNARCILGFTYYKQDRYSEAERLLTTLLRQVHPNDLEVARQLSLVYVAQGRYTDAETVQKGVVETSNSTLGYEHLSSHRARLSLASTYYKQGRYSDAKALQLESLEQLKSKLGDMHPEVLVTMRELSVTNSAMGQYSEAERLLSDACNGLNTILGEAHVDTLIAQLHLTSVYYNKGRYMEAETHQLQRLEILKSQVGQKHLLTLQATRLLALTYCAEGKYTEAVELQADMTQRLGDALGSNNPDTFIAMRERAWTEGERGNFHDGIVLQEEALKGLKQILGELHPETLVTTRDYASLLSATGHYSGARVNQEFVVLNLEEKLGGGHPDSIIAMLNLAETYSALRLQSDAQRIQKKAMNGLRVAEVRQHAGILAAMYKLGLKNQSVEVKSLMRKIKRIRQLGGTDYVLFDLFQDFYPVEEGSDEDETMESEEEDGKSLL